MPTTNTVKHPHTTTAFYIHGSAVMTQPGAECISTVVCVYFKSCPLHGKFSVQNNKGYFLCHVSGSGILSGMKVKYYKIK